MLAVYQKTQAESSPVQAPRDDFRDMMEYISPEFTPIIGMSDSPIDDTPLFTPAMDFLSSPASVWASPAFVDNDSFPSLFDPALMDPALIDMLCTIPKPVATTSPDALLNTPNADNLYTISETPLLNNNVPLPEPSSPAVRNGPTGHRRGVTSSSMVPLEAPTQPRNYYGASKTSRKVIPAAFANKRKRTREEAGFGIDEEDELVLEDDLPSNLKDAIANKRRQNTLAARRSRQRKAETARQQADAIDALSDANALLRQEVEQLKAENQRLRRLAHQ